LATDPTLQNSGLGKILLSAAEQWAGDRGGRRIRMNVVNVRDALIAWYLRRGYRKTGETEPFPYGDDRFGAPLRDDLRFLVLEKDLIQSHFRGKTPKTRRRDVDWAGMSAVTLNPNASHGWIGANVAIGGCAKPNLKGGGSHLLRQ
jgi:Acetyltransferase (GNAT) family